MIEPHAVVTELAEYATRYQEEIFDEVPADLVGGRNELLDANARTGLEFFYRLYGFNRPEAMKAGYQHKAADALRKGDSKRTIDPDALWQRFEQKCEHAEIGANERRNRKLLLQTARFVNRRGNPFRWVARELGNDVRLRTLSAELESIHGMGPGKTRFFLRDAVWLCGARADVLERDRYVLQSMTGPITEISRVLWPNLEDDNEMAKRIAESCANAGVSGIEFNQGAWYFRSRELADGESTEQGLRRVCEGRRR